MLYQPKTERSKPLFSHPFLEKLARTHIAVPLSIYALGITALMYTGFSKLYFNVAQGIGVFLAGLTVWTLFEYIAHKHIFHMLPTNKFKERVQYTFHGVHHEFPRDKDRLAMPPAASIIILTVLFFLIKVLIGNYTYAFLSGFIMGYSLYLFVHYAVHAYPPPKNFLNVLWINHSIHHYKNDEVAFGVSSPLWDAIFGTLPAKTYHKRKPKDAVSKKAANDSVYEKPAELVSHH